MKQKLTPWFGRTENPVRQGWYLTQTPRWNWFCSENMLYWNGKGWQGKKKGAYIWTEPGFRWCGLARKPK